jgi:type II secretory pathway predicted ATPase ExeA/DNA-binding MarR family transcriptional regulator
MPDNQYEYYSKFGWSSNPFTLNISPTLMVGYSEQCESLLSHVCNLHKFASVIGPTGSGKTTMLLWLRSQLMAYKKFLPYYISKPPRSSKNLVDIFKSIVGFNFFDKVRFKNLSLFDLSRFIQNKLKEKHLVLLVDEAHEASIANLEWFRTLSDSVPNMTVILAALPVFEKTIETRLPTLFMRITTKAYLNNLSKPELESLILKRIESVGDKCLNPFSSSSVDRIYEITGGFPREIIKICDKLVKEASSKNITSINASFVDQVISPPPSSQQMELQVTLSKKQNQILKLLSENPNLVPSSIIDHLDISSYKNKDNAIRSMNNILKRLLHEDLIQRKKLGNTYVYYLSPKSKTMFTEA